MVNISQKLVGFLCSGYCAMVVAPVLLNDKIILMELVPSNFIIDLSFYLSIFFCLPIY